ncbi:pH-response regulator protein palI/RIM9 [Aspergillus terreus]|nr:pH-response regulator protein palI/RIM9 [Aspergillus terreus]
MLLRPATPLTILLLIAFVLLLLSVISTPIVKGIPLATFKNVDYGVFGYCKNDKCTNIHVGYTNDDMTSTGSSSDFNLPSTTRVSLSSILIVHPVAALLTLICLCMAIAAHFHGPSHSPRYLLALLILLLPTLLVTLLAFLVDILLFVPHLGWGGWIVLAATIIHVSCGVVTCAMRRTLVSRKARKKRIAENAEMSGENFYNRQNAAAAAAAVNEPKAFQMETKDSFVTPPGSDNGPTFATFRTNTRESDDDRTPLNSRTPANDAEHQFQVREDAPYQREDTLPPGPIRTPTWARAEAHPLLDLIRGDEVATLLVAATVAEARSRPMPPPEEAAYDYHDPPNGQMRQPSPGPIGMAVSADAGPIGQAIEMTPQPRRTGSTEPQMQDSLEPQPHAVSADGYAEPVSPSSLYSRTPSYVPPRAGWGADLRVGPSPSPVHAYGARGMNRSPQTHVRSNSGDYYEDNDPRFANRNESAVGNPRLPTALTPGNNGEQKLTEGLAEEPSSPTTSDISHFTSISERPINPRWRPPPLPAQQKRDVLLENNPDFDLRAGAGRGGGAGSRMPPISATRYPLP